MLGGTGRVDAKHVPAVRRTRQSRRRAATAEWSLATRRAATATDACLSGGTERLNRKKAVRALSGEQVAGIVDRFAALNPYDEQAIQGSELEVKDVNCDQEGRPRQLWCYAISTKRYALYALDDRGEPVPVKWSDHGLGHLLNPTDPGSDDRDWMCGL